MKDKDNVLGVALVMELCPICAVEIAGPIIMNTRLTKKNAKEVESMHGKVVGWSKEPCESCKELKKKGFILIGAVQAKSIEGKDPYRSGNIWVIHHEKAIEMFSPEYVLKGAAFIDVLDAQKMGLPDVKLDA